MFLDKFDVEVCDDVLALPIPDQVETRQRLNDIIRLNESALTQFLNGNVSLVNNQRFQQSVSPIALVTNFAHIRQWSFGSANTAPLHGQVVAETDQELAVASALVWRQHHDTSKVVIVTHRLLLGEVAYYVGALFVIFGQDVEKEGRHVEVQRLVVEKQFG